MKEMENTAPEPGKTKDRRLSLAMKLGSIVIIMVLGCGALWAWFFSNRLEETITSATSKLIVASEKETTAISLQQLELSVAVDFDFILFIISQLKFQSKVDDVSNFGYVPILL